MSGGYTLKQISELWINLVVDLFLYFNPLVYKDLLMDLYV